MLRMYFIQHWFNLSDEGCEDALLDSPALRRFVGIDLGVERVPDATTLLKFRRLIEDKVRCPRGLVARRSRVRSTRDGDRTDEEAIHRGTDHWLPA